MINYKDQYLEIKKKYEDLKARVQTRKEDLVTECYELLSVKQDEEIPLTYGYFIWKLTVDELLFLKKKLAR